MGFGDFIDKVAGSAGSVSSGMSSKMDTFKSKVESYNQIKQMPSFSTFSLPFGGESKKITAGLPQFDLPIAEEAGGLFDSVKEGISDLVGSEFTEAFEAGVQAAGGVKNAMETAGGMVDNFSSLGDSMGAIAENVQAIGADLSAIRGEKKDLLKEVTAMRDMFGFSANEVFGDVLEPSTSRMKTLTDQFKMVSEVTSLTHDLANGRPNVVDFIDGKYPQIGPGIDALDVPGNISGAMENIVPVDINSSLPLPTAVKDLANTLNTTVQATQGLKNIDFSTGEIVDDVPDSVFGNVLGNPQGESDGFFERAMGKANTLVSSATTGLQKDLYENFPSVEDAVDHVVPSITKQVQNAIPNTPKPDTITDNMIRYDSPLMSIIEADVIQVAIDDINATAPTGNPSQEEMYLTDTEIIVWDEFTRAPIESGEGSPATPMPSAKDQFVMQANDAITSELNKLGKSLVSLPVEEAVEIAQNVMNDKLDGIMRSVNESVNGILEINNRALPVGVTTTFKTLPSFPDIAKASTDAIKGLDSVVAGSAGDIADAVSGLAGGILVGEYGAGFNEAVKQSLDSSLSAIVPSLPGIPDPTDPQFISEVVEQVKSSIIPNVPNFPTGADLRGQLDTILQGGVESFISSSGLDSIKGTLDGVQIDMDNITGTIGNVVNNTGANLVTNGFNALTTNFDIAGTVAGNLAGEVSNIASSFSNVLNTSLPSVQAQLPDVVGFLNTEAKGLMDGFKNHMPAFPAGAPEALGNLMNFAQNISAVNLGNLTSGVQGMMANVDFKAIPIPNISNLQMGQAVQGLMGAVEGIQSAQYFLDSMDKAKEMIPNVEGVMATFEGFSWEGSGFSLGMIGSYFTDADSADEMTALIDAQLAGAPPAAMANAKMNQALGMANSMKAQAQAKKAEALAAVDTIKEIFKMF